LQGTDFHIDLYYEAWSIFTHACYEVQLYLLMAW
jgi:hypothetical protein